MLMTSGLGMVDFHMVGDLGPPITSAQIIPSSPSPLSPSNSQTSENVLAGPLNQNLRTTLAHITAKHADYNVIEMVRNRFILSDISSNCPQYGLFHESRSKFKHVDWARERIVKLKFELKLSSFICFEF